MFIADEVLVNLSFPAARDGLAGLVYRSLVRAAEGASGEGLAGLTRVGPMGARAGLSKLVDVHVLELVSRKDCAVLAVRWEATGPAGLFPALDADITLTPAGPGVCRMSLTGAYRPPFAAIGTGLDRAILRRAAQATSRSFLTRVAQDLDHSRSRPDDHSAGRCRPGLPPRGQTDTAATKPH
jgi:hypothetical protein